MGKKYKIKIHDVMIAVGVIGILASILVPYYFAGKKREKIEKVQTSASQAKNKIHNWMFAIKYPDKKMADFDGGGFANSNDVRVKPDSIATIPAAWDSLHQIGGPLETKSPYSIDIPLFNKDAVEGSGQIAVQCSDHTCLILGYTNKPEDGVIFDEWVTVE